MCLKRTRKHIAQLYISNQTPVMPDSITSADANFSKKERGKISKTSCNYSYQIRLSTLSFKALLKRGVAPENISDIY